MSHQKLKEKLIDRDGLKCSITSESVGDPSELEIGYLVPKSEGGGSELDNLILVKKELNFQTSNDASRQTKMLIEELRNRENELVHREKEAYKREAAYRQELEKQKSELNNYRHNISSEQNEREKELSKSLEERREVLKQQEMAIQAYKREFEENIHSQSKEVDALRFRLKEELAEKEVALDAAQQELEKEKKKYTEESRKNIEKKSNAYVNDALSILEFKENKFHKISNFWSIAGGMSIIFGIATVLYFGIEGVELLKDNAVIGWGYVLLVTFKGLILVGLFIALAKYAFTFSQSYMHESVKNSERRHAINFGKFYLETYGADASWGQIKDAFEHWNIVSDSAFSKHETASFDPKSVESAVSLINAISKLSPLKNSDEKKQ